MLRLLGSGAVELARLVVPVVCPGCGALDLRWCADCVAALTPGPPRRVEADAPRLDRLDGVPPLPVWACAPYAGPVRELVPAWKDQGRLDLTATMVAAMTGAGRHLGAVLGAADAAVLGAADGPVLVVPVPTTAAARRRRGADLVAELAGGVVVGLGEAGWSARRAGLLVKGSARDQVGLGARARGRVVVRVRTRPPPPPAAAVLLVDDVLTTGGTMAACESALAASGTLVLGAVVLAATPGRGRTSARRAEDVGPLS